MPDDEFTISEFAGLRNIDINSLRYYEKIGLLKPARVDRETRYRYYRAEQLPALDTIMLCVDLGIPLKELLRYIDTNGVLQSQKLFEYGKILVQKRIHALRLGLDKIEYSIRYMEQCNEFSDRTGLYERAIPKRRFFCVEYTGKVSDMKRVQIESTKLFQAAQNAEATPVFPAGIILKFNGSEAVSCRLFFEIAEKELSHRQIMEIPEGSYRCMQSGFLSTDALMDTLHSNFEENKPIIISNMLFEKYHFNDRKCEIQQLV